MVKVTNHHIDTLRDVSERLANLANSLLDNGVSFDVEFSTRPVAIYVHAYEWKSGETNDVIKVHESYRWNLDRDPEEVEKSRLGLLTKVAEWEVKYGTFKSKSN